MKRFAISLVTAAAMFVGVGAVRAQVPVVSYYSPTTVYYPTPAAPTYVAPSPTVTYYSPPASTYYPTTTYYAPSYYSAPAAPVVTRYRPVLGRTFTRYAPTYYYSY
jgi:hypothetical protein